MRGGGGGSRARAGAREGVAARTHSLPAHPNTACNSDRPHTRAVRPSRAQFPGDTPPPCPPLTIVSYDRWASTSVDTCAGGGRAGRRVFHTLYKSKCAVFNTDTSRIGAAAEHERQSAGRQRGPPATRRPRGKLPSANGSVNWQWGPGWADGAHPAGHDGEQLSADVDRQLVSHKGVRPAAQECGKGHPPPQQPSRPAALPAGFLCSNGSA